MAAMAVPVGLSGLRIRYNNETGPSLKKKGAALADRAPHFRRSRPVQAALAIPRST
jgi:hypothetical protein